MMNVEVKRHTSTEIQVDGKPIDYANPAQCQAAIEYLMRELDAARESALNRATYVRPLPSPWIEDQRLPLTPGLPKQRDILCGSPA